MIVEVLRSGSLLLHHPRQAKCSWRQKTWDSTDGILSEDTIPVILWTLTTCIDSYHCIK
jgi:hypothetical protein